MLALILVLVLSGHVPKEDLWCKQVPERAWSVSIATALYYAQNYYGVKEPNLSRLRACLMKPVPRP